MVKSNFRNNCNSLLLYELLGRGTQTVLVVIRCIFSGHMSVGGAATGFFLSLKREASQIWSFGGNCHGWTESPCPARCEGSRRAGHGASPAPAAHESLWGLLCANPSGNLREPSRECQLWDEALQGMIWNCLSSLQHLALQTQPDRSVLSWGART